MDLDRYIIIFAVAFSFVSFSTGNIEITLQLFEKHQCSSICTEKKFSVHLKKICDQINPEERPAKAAKCQQTPVAMKDEDFKTWLHKLVGMCSLSNGVRKCVTMGFEANTVFIFPYTNTCDEPYAEKFEFPEVSNEVKKPEGGGILGAIASFFRCCFGG